MKTNNACVCSPKMYVYFNYEINYHRGIPQYIQERVSILLCCEYFTLNLSLISTHVRHRYFVLRTKRWSISSKEKRAFLNGR